MQVRFNWVVRIVVAAIVALGVFQASVQRLFHLNFWTSLALAVFAAVVAMLDVLKKMMEPRKLGLEISKLAREEKEKSFIVRVATEEEIRKYGRSYVEISLDRRFQHAREDKIVPKPFMAEPKE
jgi:hypothetical protein